MLLDAVSKKDSYEVGFVNREERGRPAKYIELTVFYFCPTKRHRILSWWQAKQLVSRWKATNKKFNKVWGSLSACEISVISGRLHLKVVASFVVEEFPEVVLHRDYRAVTQDEKRTMYSKQAVLQFYAPRQKNIA